MTSETSFEHSNETSGLEASGLPINPEVMFTNKKNVHKPKIEKRQRELLASVSFLKPFLAQGEIVLLVTTGCSPMSFMEQYLTGWVIYYLKRSLFVFTDRRIFHIPSTYGFKYRGSVAQVRYEDCCEIKVRGHVLTVLYNTGDKEKFYFIASKERAKVRALAPTLGLGKKTGKRAFLCPTCTSVLEPEVFECSQCGQEFKSKGEARKISWLFPGGGYFYTGHYVLGLLDAVVETFLIVMIIVSALELEEGPSDTPGWIFLVIVLVIEKLLTVYHSNAFVGEYLPKPRPGRSPVPTAPTRT